jgi:hypothetical protein
MFAFTACFHLAAAIRPSVDPEAPTWRHLLFIGINLTTIAGLIRRPLIFIPAFGVLLIQQLVTHGTHAWKAFAGGGSDWPSIAVVIVMLVTMTLLIVDAFRCRPAA